MEGEVLMQNDLMAVCLQHGKAKGEAKGEAKGVLGRVA
jgi:hypothetical protein